MEGEDYEERQLEKGIGKESLYRFRTWKEQEKGTDIQKQIMNNVTNGIGYLKVDDQNLYSGSNNSRDLLKYLELAEIKTGTIDNKELSRQFIEETLSDSNKELAGKIIEETLSNSNKELVRKFVEETIYDSTLDLAKEEKTRYDIRHTLKYSVPLN